MKPMIDEVNLEKFVKSTFGTSVNVKSLLAHQVPVGRGAAASVFLTDKSQVFALIVSRSPMNFGDVRKISRKMNLIAEDFLPPHAQKDYFLDVAERKFREVFPGRNQVSAADLAYYKTLVPYNPALILVREIKDGKIQQFDSDAVGSWRTSAKFTYRRITEIK